MSLGIGLLFESVDLGAADVTEQQERHFVEDGADGQQDIAQHGFTFFHFLRNCAEFFGFQTIPLKILQKIKTAAEPVSVRKRWALRLFT